MKWALAMVAFALLDHLIWVLVHSLPGPQLIQLSRQDPPASTCLSRSLAGRLLLDLIGVPNELHLGMSLFEDGRKVPQGWLTNGSRLLTPGLTPGYGAHLHTL
jgi:hypothetical protein